MSGLLVTGASGYLGSELLDRIVPARGGARIYLLTRDPDRIAERFRGPQFSILKGDLRRPMLGLAGWQVSALRRTLTEIIHCGAETRVDALFDEARATNSTGTGNLLELAARCERLTKFLHLSTTCIAGRLTGRIPESLITHSARFLSVYQQSKYEAETVVARYAGQVPAVIARISPIVGSERGIVNRQNAIHQLLRLFPRSHLQQAPFEPSALIDMVNSDWAAGALSWLFLNRFQAGDVWHLTDGPTADFNAAELLAETHRVFAHHPKAQAWMPLELPRLVPLAEYDNFADNAIVNGSRLTGQLLRSLGYSLPRLGLDQTFENHRTRALLAASGNFAAPAPIRQVYVDVVRWCLDTDWGESG